MRADEIREMSATDIQAKVHELEEEQFRLNFRAGTETLEDPLRLRVIRRDIARLKTVLREQKSSKNSANAPAGAAGSKAPATSPAAGGNKGDQQKTAKKSARKTAGSARR